MKMKRSTATKYLIQFGNKRIRQRRIENVQSNRTFIEGGWETFNLNKSFLFAAQNIVR